MSDLPDKVVDVLIQFAVAIAVLVVGKRLLKKKKKRKNMALPASLNVKMTEARFNVIWMLVANNAQLLALITPTQLDDTLVAALTSPEVKASVLQELKDRGVVVG